VQRPVTRRLVAVLVADVVGFSRHMEHDDAGTVARLREIRATLFDPKIHENGGRIVKTTGDGMLIEFGSADASLRCAVDVQRAMAARNANEAASDRIAFRIGINLGDIIIDGDDIMGDGVNVAARLEALAEPGGIAVSGTVRDQVHGSLDVAFVDAGERQVKNIARPIRVFMVDLQPSVASRSTVDARGNSPLPAVRPLPVSRRMLRGPRSVWVASVIAIGAAAVFAVWWSTRAAPAPSPPAMTIGVVPLVALDGDAASARRAESITRDLTAMVARASTLIRVIPVPTAQARAAYDDIGAAFRALNVRYLAEGEVRQGQDSTLVGVRLVNAKTGEQSWSESVSLKDADTPDARSRALHAIAWHLSRSLISAELRRVAAQPPGEAAPLESVLRALALDRTEPDSLKRAREKEKLFDQALQRDPNLVPALVGLAGVLVQKIEYDIRADRDRLVQRMDDLTSKAVRLNESQPTTWFFRSIALMFMGQWNASLEASAKAVRLEPYSSGLILNQASLMTLSGRPAEALMLVNQAMGMDPQGNPGQMAVACEAQLLLGHYEQAVTSCEKAKGLSGDNTMVDLFLSAAYAQLGNAGKATAAKDDVQRSIPGYTIATHKAKRYSVNPEYVRLADEHLYSGMRKAGFAEQ